MVDAGFAAEAYVPQPVTGMTTRRVLFMELLQGPKLKDGLSVYAEILATEKGLTLDEFEAAETERIEQEGAGPYTGPTATTMQAYLQAAKTWDSIRNLGVWGYNAVCKAVQKDLFISCPSQSAQPPPPEACCGVALDTTLLLRPCLAFGHWAEWHAMCGIVTRCVT